MTTDAPIEKRVNLTVNGIAHVQGNRGEQWEIQIKYPFSLYPTKQWVDKDGFNAEPKVGETYPCIILRGVLTSDKDGKIYDGTLDWMYRWRITDFNTTSDAPAPAPTQQASAPSPAPAAANPPFPAAIADPRQHSFERQTVFKAAVDLAIAVTMGNRSARTPKGSGEVTLLGSVIDIEELASELWPVLQGIGPDPVSDAPGPPESDASPAANPNATINMVDSAPTASTNTERATGSDAEVDDILTPSTASSVQDGEHWTQNSFPHPDLPRQTADPNEGETEPGEEETR